MGKALWNVTTHQHILRRNFRTHFVPWTLSSYASHWHWVIRSFLPHSCRSFVNREESRHLPSWWPAFEGGWKDRRGVHPPRLPNPRQRVANPAGGRGVRCWFCVENGINDFVWLHLLTILWAAVCFITVVFNVDVATPYGIAMTFYRGIVDGDTMKY